MINVINRFHGHGSLRFVYRNGRVIRSRLFTLKYTENTRRKHSRFAVVVSKKVFKGSVGRNRIRRRIYEVLRNQIPNLNNIYDIVIIASIAEMRTMPFADLEAAIVEALKEAMIID